ncbi:MAG TPA: DUF5074 domain-containing protein [Edaphocola sp.]|nr:DUF5074 domain-containing protein [Edaphocola sp.]
MKVYCHLLLFFIISLSACVKDKPDPGKSNPAMNEHPKMFIANEGAFGNGNASLSYIDLINNQVVNNVFSAQNDGKVLGDVFQNIQGDNQNLYLVINNSDRIIVINKKDFKQKQIINVEQPRQMAFIDETRVLVSSMYRKKLYIVNLISGSIENSIPFPYPNSEGLLRVKNKIYICPWDVSSSHIYVFDISSRTITDSFDFGNFAPTNLALDKNNDLWISSGNPQKGVAAALTKINLINKQILKTISFPENTEVIKPCFNMGSDTLYFLAVNYNATNSDYNGLYRIPINADIRPTTAFVKAEALQYFWSLSINPYNGHIFLGDPRGWIQSGQVLELNTSGLELNRYNVGVGPSNFYFD